MFSYARSVCFVMIATDRTLADGLTTVWTGLLRWRFCASGVEHRFFFVSEGVGKSTTEEVESFAVHVDNVVTLLTAAWTLGKGVDHSTVLERKGVAPFSQQFYFD